ncbi:phosphoribosylformylglycinamidine cyclo-ligase [Vampirovibrio sp.]|uniref:phosphoribosylformylglycinamidine cyclo-ligase n=1 Tax=Vampirovibrio sp. TaxID=2717857 RepID=UPI003593A762
MTTLSSDEAYRQAGVDLKSAEAVVDIARNAARQTQKPWLLGGIGGFSGAFEIPAGYRQPVLLCGCDGVGTKLKLAFEANRHDTVGIDLVAMSVNDILVNGGQPLVFLDYLATQKIEGEQLAQVLSGIAQGCEQADCALIGGETAEMPGFYAPGEYDLAGFCVGVAEKENLYPRKANIGPGNVLIGLASNGLHSNGYSLVRKILFSDHQQDLNAFIPELNAVLADVLLAPTRIYVKPVLKILEKHPQAVQAMVHVTGGGFYDNIPRVLTPAVSAEIDASSWPLPPIFAYLQTLGALSDETLWHTFNCGIGYILVVAADQAQAVLDSFHQETDEKAFIIGQLTPAQGQPEVIVR